MHKVKTIECSCGVKMELTEIQFDDFDCGMMGFLKCPKCNKVLMPSGRAEGIKITEREEEGEDMGWS